MGRMMDSYENSLGLPAARNRLNDWVAVSAAKGPAGLPCFPLHPDWLTRLLS
jgi:hypothetical protein